MPSGRQRAPRSFVRIIHFSNGFLTFCALRFLLRTLLAHPSFQKTSKTHWFYNTFDTFIGPMLSHQWRVKKMRSGPSSPQRGPQENAQTIYFKTFLTFFWVQIRRGNLRGTDGRTSEKRAPAPSPPRQRTQERNTTFGATPSLR